MPDKSNGESSIQTTLIFHNIDKYDRRLFWIGYDGTLTEYPTIHPGASLTQPTYVGTAWKLTDSNGVCATGVLATEPAEPAAIINVH